MIEFLIGMLLAGVYWIALIFWGVYVGVAGRTWAGWRARVPDLLWFLAAALALGFLIGWDRAVRLASIGGLMSIIPIVVQAISLARFGERP